MPHSSIAALAAHQHSQPHERSFSTHELGAFRWSSHLTARSELQSKVATHRADWLSTAGPFAQCARTQCQVFAKKCLSTFATLQCFHPPVLQLRRWVQSHHLFNSKLSDEEPLLHSRLPNLVSCRCGCL